jgi:hypothetical protein
MSDGIMGAGRILFEPPKLPPNAERFALKTLADIVRDMPREGRDIMLTADANTSAITGKVLDYCEFYFNGTVDRATRVEEGKVYHMATFVPSKTTKGKTNG